MPGPGGHHGGGPGGMGGRGGPRGGMGGPGGRPGGMGGPGMGGPGPHGPMHPGRRFPHFGGRWGGYTRRPVGGCCGCALPVIAVAAVILTAIAVLLF